jgi:hypothetical protein
VGCTAKPSPIARSINTNKTTKRNGGLNMITTTMMQIGFPSRPTGGGELPDSFKLLPTEVATPKLNGDRVLMSHEGVCYNRKMQKYTKIEAEDALNLHQTLNFPSDRTAYAKASQVQWWDLEYISHGKNKGCAVVIDVITGGRRNYHDRQNIIEHLPRASHKWTENICSEWRESFESTYCPAPQSPRKVFKFPYYANTMVAKINYGQMKRRYEQYLGEDRTHDYLWEGLVIQDTSVEYELTTKQSMNMHIQTKYRFN